MRNQYVAGYIFNGIYTLAFSAAILPSSMLLEYVHVTP